MDDENFLSTVIETDNKEIEQKKNKQKGFNLMANMVTEYIPLAPYETQNYAMFPHKIKSFLTPDFIRFGIKNLMEKNLNIVNISFLNSLNMLIRPDICKLNLDDHIKNFNMLEGFICHKIKRNFQIDKTKNTKKVQAVNQELIKNLSEGKISHELIQSIVNIFEINLLVFDLTKMDIYLYWTKGNKYSFLNLFKNICGMSYIQGNYEPVMLVNNSVSEEQRRKMYVHILTNLSEIKCFPEVKLGIHSMIYLNTWDIDTQSYNTILDLFFKKLQIDVHESYNKLIELEKK